MYPEPAHGRFRLAPSGPAHIGHWVLGKLSADAARMTGGTFTMRCQQLWATRDSVTWEKYVANSRQNMEDLRALGIEPSHPEVFLSHGMLPSWAVQVSDDRGLIDAYWRRLRLDELFGEWPVAVDEKHRSTCIFEPQWHSWYMTDQLSNNPLCHQAKHPYMQFAQLVGEVTTGRNCIIRGGDHMQDKAFADAFYPVIAKLHYRLDDVERLCALTPAQFFVPRINRKSGGRIASSAPEESAGYFLSDIAKAGVDCDRLWRFMGRVLWGSYVAADLATASFSEIEGAADSQIGRTAHPGVTRALQSIVPNPMIDDEEWAVLLSSRGRKLP